MGCVIMGNLVNLQILGFPTSKLCTALQLGNCSTSFLHSSLTSDFNSSDRRASLAMQVAEMFDCNRSCYHDKNTGRDYGHDRMQPEDGCARSTGS